MSSRVSIGIISILSIALIALGVFAITSISNLNSEIDGLEEATSALQESSSGKSKSSLKEVAKRLRKVEECFPELQAEINSMELENIGEEFYVGVGSQVSSYCSDVVYSGEFGD